jgi:hypothetical protein
MLTTSNAPIGSRMLVPLSCENLFDYGAPPFNQGFVVVTILPYSYVGIRKGEKRPNYSSPDMNLSSYKKDIAIDPLIDWMRSASDIRCFPAMNRRMLQCN